jgi:chromosomal replication initiation ATPase DnaA
MTARRGQLVLDLPHRPALGREDFLVAGCNEAAVAWIDRWPDWPVPSLALVGPEDSGKTHLAQVWRARSGGALLRRADITGPPDALLGGAAHAVIEAADAPGDDEALFHLYNHVAGARGTLLFCARSAPARWPVGLADLASRLRAMPVAEIGLPDDDLLGALLTKHLRDRQIAAGHGVLRYLVPRMERSFAAAATLAEALDKAALAEGKAVTMPIARAVMGEGEQGAPGLTPSLSLPLPGGGDEDE